MAATVRRPADRDLKQARTRALSHLRREATANRQRALDEAAAAIRRAQTCTDAMDPSDILARVVLDHVRDVTTPVLAGLGLTSPIDLSITSDARADACTDYKKISVAMPIKDFPKAYPSPTDVKRLVTVTKGLVYHEAGHILYSVPFEHLSRSAAQQGATMPREFTNTAHHRGISRFSWVQNILEDQRMECAMVRLSPVFENHFRVTAMYMILQPMLSRGRASMMWPFLSGRTYLPKNLLASLRADALEQATNLGLLDAFRAIESGVRAYKRGVTERELFDAVVATTDAFIEWFDNPADMMRTNVDTHRDPGHDVNRSNRMDLTMSATGRVEDEDDNEDGDENDMGTPSDTSDSGVAPVRHLRESVALAIKETIDESVTQSQVNEMITDLNIALGRGLPRDPTVFPMTVEESRKAHQVKAGMLDVLEPLMTRVGPGWVFRQDEGVLDPVTFTLRSPGDTDFWSRIDGEEQPGRDFAVSLVLDVSHSMGNRSPSWALPRWVCDWPASFSESRARSRPSPTPQPWSSMPSNQPRRFWSRVEEALSHSKRSRIS